MCLPAVEDKRIRNKHWRAGKAPCKNFRFTIVDDKEKLRCDVILRSTHAREVHGSMYIQLEKFMLQFSVTI